ncbi:hypothetical protein [uncultured Erythrobacter sp.]|uniref:hypothetical protein n=1 Tax=uncultured Erythrobacter sp. TaxID=263913 RepID=UPI00261CF3DC|nr:hypothetical protein [uncultured Erythrobacter sp.]
MTQEYLKWSDLAALDSSPEEVRAGFEKMFLRQPNGIALNKTVYFDENLPSCTQRDGYWCYKTLGEIAFSPGPDGSLPNPVVGSNLAINKSEETATITVEVDCSWQESTSWSSSVTEGMSYSEEINLAGSFKSGTSFNISTTTGGSSSHSVTKTELASVSVKVPPRSKIRVDMVANFATETMNFTAPIQVTGWMGCNYDPPLNDHYFYYSEVEALLPKTSALLSGKITNTYSMQIQSVIGRVEPID